MYEQQQRRFSNENLIYFIEIKTSVKIEWMHAEAVITSFRFIASLSHCTKDSVLSKKRQSVFIKKHIFDNLKSFILLNNKS